MPGTKEISLYIARDARIIDEDGILTDKGEIHLFYDKPLYNYDDVTNSWKYGHARCVGKVPSYMYPGLKSGQCLKLLGYIVNDENEKYEYC